jgi:multisubunit Na+/H+ antiporter MnhG subunit
VRDTIAWVLLAAGGAVEVFGIAGVVLMRGALERLHYLGTSTLATVLVAVAIVVRESFSQIGILALLLAAFVAFAAPVMGHVTGRAILLSGKESE